MDTLTLSATEFRDQLFPLIDRVGNGELVVRIIKKDTKRQVTLTKPAAKKQKSFALIAKESYGILKNVPEAAFYDDRLRGRRAKLYLDKLRKPW
jgi:hypothetical protein